MYDCFVVLIFINNQKRIPTMVHNDIITVLSVFSTLFSTNVWNHAQILLTGAILCNNQRTIAAVLRVMGLSHDKHFNNYYRVLNRVCWSGLQAGKILLGLLIKLLPESLPIIIGIDDTIERRKGKKLNDCRLEIGRFQKVKTESHSERLKPAESWSLAQAN